MGTVYMVKRKVSEIGSLYKSIEKSIANMKNQKTTPSGKNEVAPELANVTEAQLETMKLIAEGHSNSEIAKIRGVSEKSVEQAISRLVAHLDLPKGATKNQRVQISKMYFRLTGSRTA
jgi:DNA-binding NarL/FixJ family response regulator